MNIRQHYFLTMMASLVLACGGGDGKTGGSSEGSASEASASSTSTASASDTGVATEPGTSDTPTGDGGTGTGTGGDTTTGVSTMATSGTTGVTETTSTTAVDPDTTAGTTEEGTTSETLAGFERFKLSRAAGPCPPNMDCDGFIELLADRTLRVEPFGEQGDPVTEAEISEDDMAAAVQVFAAVALVQLLDSPEPLCNAPRDVFESMQVDIDGGSHDADTAFCDQAPLGAARDMANMLAMKYAP
jgi:hypothetical protein